MKAYVPEVIADSSGQWVGNGLTFATEDEAKRYVRDLEMRWMSVRDTRVVQVDQPVKNAFVDGQLVFLEDLAKTKLSAADIEQAAEAREIEAHTLVPAANQGGAPT